MSRVKSFFCKQTVNAIDSTLPSFMVPRGMLGSANSLPLCVIARSLSQDHVLAALLSFNNVLLTGHQVKRHCCLS